MPFTGRIGTQNSKLGDIVLGIVDAFELASIGFKVHVLSSTEIRVRFDHPVTDSALSASSYVLSAITPSAVVPAVLGVEFYDADRLSVVVTVSQPLTWTTTYAIQLNGIQDFNGQGVSGVSTNFTANVPDPPRAIGAFLSKRGMVDVVFDRAVGSLSTGAAATIRDSSSGPGVAMSLQPWLAEGIPEDTLRFVYPITTPTAVAFSIDYSSVLDASNNVGSGTVGLTVQLRSPPPYNSGSLSLMQFIDACVTEIVPNIDVATVRVFFNGPANSVETTNPARWTVKQGGPHLHPDTVHPVLVPDAVTIVDAFNILNAVKTTLSAHVLEQPVHYSVDKTVSVTALNAVDSPSAIFLYNDIVNVFKDHMTGVDGKAEHLYVEPIIPAAIVSGSPDSVIIAATNAMLFLYNQHLAEERVLPFYTDYPAEIGEITDHGSTSNCFAVRTQQTFYADLHVKTAVQSIPIRVLGTIQSEDLGGSTNPADFTGDVMARAVLDPPAFLTREVVYDRSATVSFDREVSFPDFSTVVVRNGLTGPLVPSGVTSSSTLVDATWLYNSLVHSYLRHISLDLNGAGHLGVETQFFVVPADYVTSTDLPTLIAKANLFKAKLNGHVQSTFVHIEGDSLVRSADAVDFPSLVTLLDDMRRTFTAHNSAGNGPSPYGPVPTRPGRHNFPGRVFLVAKLLSSVAFELDSMLDGAVHDVSLSGLVLNWDMLRSMPSIVPFSASANFVGVAQRPALASVLPRPGLVLHEDREGQVFFTFESDSLEVYFSKRMHKTELNGGTGSSIGVTGGSIILKRTDWVDERTASVAVSRMEQIAYTLSATGLVDLAGNPIV